MEKFFSGDRWPGTEKTVSQVVESIRLNAEWLTRDEAAIREYVIRQE